MKNLPDPAARLLLAEAERYARVYAAWTCARVSDRAYAMARARLHRAITRATGAPPSILGIPRPRSGSKGTLPKKKA